MKLIRSLKLFAFETLQRFLSGALRRRIGQSRLIEPLRNRFFRPSGRAELASSTVTFERLHFRFTAPYQILAHARSGGIERRLCRLIMSQCREGAVCIDVGANCGFLSVIMGLSVGAEGRVLAFEPDPMVYPVLLENLRANDLQTICTPFPLAIGLESDGSLFGTSILALDRIASEQAIKRLDVIKIDVDGADFHVLLGARELLERFHPIVIVEMHANQDGIHGFLVDLGYRHFFGMEGENVRPGNWPPNLIAAMHPVRIPPHGTLRAARRESQSK